MPKFIDRTGQKFGRLTVLREAGRNGLKKVVWSCACECGAIVTRTAGDLVTGNSVSCGCYLRERITKHGGWKRASYNTWRAMMRRCYNPNDRDFKRYGAVGVTVCSPWHDYLTFAAAMGEPVGTQTLDRIDPYGNYELGNCRWASPRVQARNTRVRFGNAAGYAGVCKVGNKWRATIKASGRNISSKSFTLVEDAVAERKRLESVHWAA
jgi:hypothetical protein